jgi:hypothetical protein
MLALTLAVMLQFQMKMPAAQMQMRAVQHQHDDGSGARTFICPKDETLLRVKSPEPGAEYKCPVDGTVMRAGKGPESKYFLLDEKKR